MRFILTFGFVLLLAPAIWAQVESPLDSLSEAAAAVEIPAAKDTIFQSIIPNTNLEYIPAEETPELIADRLSCLEGTIPLDYNDKVHAFINYFTIRDREYTRMVLRRKDTYFPLFEKYLAQYNLPSELKYLSVIESGLNPKAVSRARAVGLWQFMSGTGRFMGLHNDWYVDERMDPEKSTEAACRFLSMLYSMFNDWPLALAAYNSGPGTVRKAIRLSGYKKTFWEVYPYLPRETRAYVPQYIAMIYSVNFAEQHNLVEATKEELPPYDTLMTRQFLHFETFANLTGTCLEDMQHLNPSVQRNALPGGKKYIIKVPLTAKANLELNRRSILDSAAKGEHKELELLARTGVGSTYGRDMIVYQVKSGDGLGTIAYRHGVRVDDLRYWNNLNSNMIHPGRNLNIWVKPNTKAVATTVPQPVSSPDGALYIVQPGDTLWDIARKFQGLTIERIKTLNNLKSNMVKPGQKLIVG